MNFKAWFELYEAKFPRPITLHGKEVGSDEEFDSVSRAFDKEKYGWSDDQIDRLNKKVDNDDFEDDRDPGAARLPPQWQPFEDPEFGKTNDMLKDVIPDNYVRQQLFDAIHDDPMARLMFQKVVQRPGVTKKEVEKFVDWMKSMGIFQPKDAPQRLDQPTWVGGKPPADSTDNQPTNITPIPIYNKDGAAPVRFGAAK